MKGFIIAAFVLDALAVASATHIAALPFVEFGAVVCGVAGVQRSVASGSSAGKWLASAAILAAGLVPLAVVIALAASPTFKHHIMQPIITTLDGGMALAAVGRQAEVMMNCSEVVEQCRAYAAEHGSFPPSLDVLLDKNLISPDRLREPVTEPSADIGATRTSSAVPASHPPSSAAPSASQHLNYSGCGITRRDALSETSSRIIVIYSGDWYDGKGVVAGFADGHSEFIEKNDLSERAREDEHARAVLDIHPEGCKIAPRFPGQSGQPR